MIDAGFMIAQQQLAQTDASPVRVVALGTSHTARGGWQRPLADALARCLARPVDVVNRGKSGAGSQWGRTQVAAIAATGPDIVLIEFAANDAALHAGVSLTRSRQNIAEIVNGLRARLPAVRIILMAMNPVSGLRGALRPSLDAYEDAYRDLAAELNIAFVDHRPAWRARSAGDLRRAIPDGVHADPMVATGVIVPALAATICRPDAPRPLGGAP